MSNESRANRAIRDAANEIRREARAAAGDVRVELTVARRETADALREAMADVRAVFADVWGETGTDRPDAAGGRPSRAQRKEMTRELLLDAAIEVFAEKGYHGASLDDVADAAGFTKGAVYSNFARKSDLFRALLVRETERRTAALRGAVEATPLELLPDIAGALMREADADQRDRDILVVEFWLAAVRDPSLREPLASALGAFGDVIDEKLVASRTDPGLDGGEIARIMDALAVGLRMYQALDPSGEQHVLFAKAVHKLLAAGSPRSSPGEV